jgi:hypothetical protein
LDATVLFVKIPCESWQSKGCRSRNVARLAFEGLLGPTRSIKPTDGAQAHRPGGGSCREKQMTRNNNYRLIDTRIDKGVLGLHDPTRPFCVVVTDRTTGRIMHVWRYASTKGAQGRMRQCRRPT